MSSFNYGKPEHIGGGTQGTVNLVELDVFTITDGVNLTDSQLNIYWDISLGTHTTLDIKYYVRYTEGGNWYELPYRNEATGLIASVPTQVDASTPTKFVDSRPLPACLAIKGTVKGAGGGNGSATAVVMSRDN